MGTEGIFRINGNIRRKKELMDILDKDPNSTEFLNDGPIQTASLIKQFLRDLPEPLLTFELHPMFIASCSNFYL